MGVQACRLPAFKRLERLKRLNILLACPTPQATGTPRPHQWLLMGVQACRLPAFKHFKGILERPTAQVKGTPRPDQCCLLGVQACRWPAFKRLKRLKNLLARPAVFQPLNLSKASWHAQRRRQKAQQGQINALLLAFKPAVCHALIP